MLLLTKMNNVFLQVLVKLFQGKKVKQHLFKLVCHYLYLNLLNVNSMFTDSLAEKDGLDDLTYLLTSIQNLDESEEEEFIRKTLGFKEIRKERVSLRNSIPGVRPLRSNPEQKGSMGIHPPESPLPQPRQDRISELEKHLFPGGPANAKCTDDESEGSPDIVMGEPSLVHDSSDVPMTDENFTGSEIDRETPNLGARAAGHILDPEPCLPDHAYERQPGGSSVGLCRDTEVAKENEACRRSNISVEVLVLNSFFTFYLFITELPIH